MAKNLEIIRKTKRVVIKIGSSILVGREGAHPAGARPGGALSLSLISALARSVKWLKGKKVETLLVSSGAIAAGVSHSGQKSRPRTIQGLQASAAIGQPFLMHSYQKAFARQKLKVAQLLLTRGDLEDRARFLNAKNTLNELLRQGVVPIINENDSVAFEEIRVGDNDNLAALVTNVADADLLILLTDQDGFYTSDPREGRGATRIPLVEHIDSETAARAAGSTEELTVGGMKTKIEAVKKAARFGIPTFIANGRDPQILRRIFAGKDVGTLFLPAQDSLTARKHWIAHTLTPVGRITVDPGARRALVEGKKSLLPSGIVASEGCFHQGDPVDILDPEGNLIARGLVAYDGTELSEILGKKSSEIEKILGYKGPDEVIHRNDLVLL